MSDATPAHLRRLNPEQHAAVTHTGSPLLILAGAGSGKTRVLTRRVAHLLHTGVSPESILAVTFTNKAAAEMRERVTEMVGDAAKKVWVATFHSTCGRILRQEIEHLGWTRRFAIYDDEDQIRVVKEVIERLGYDRERHPPRSILAFIDHWKNRMKSVDDLVAERRSATLAQIRIWRDYEAQLKAADAVDFNDLIGLLVRLWAEHPEVLEKWREVFRHVLVDEYQDTNGAQYHLLRLLASGHRNLTVVGDDDQSIYGFRGADIRNILDFERDFPDARVVRLEQNYRCSGNILSLANLVVAANEDRLEKKLWTEADAGPPVQLIQAETLEQEAQLVARVVVRLRQELGFSWGDIAIIYRTNATSRPFEQELRRLDVPHRIVGSRRFYERREVRDILAYLRLLVNPADDAALLRIINVPRRGIGTKTLEKLREEAAGRGVPMLEAARTLSVGNDAASKALAGFVAVIDALAGLTTEVPPHELVQRVLERSSYLAMFDGEPERESAPRIENLRELVRDAWSFEAPPEVASPVEHLHAWLDRIALAGQDEKIPEGGEVTLLTVHSSKGLEFPVVFVVHMVEGSFPHARAVEAGEVAEERRLAYVAFTRAMKRLFVTRSRQSLDFEGRTRKLREHQPSRFLFRLPEDGVVGDRPGRPSDGPGGRSTRPAPAPVAHLEGPPPAAPIDPESTFTLREIESVEDLTEGARVWHPQRGLATVRAVKRRGSGLSVILLGDDSRAFMVPIPGTHLQIVLD